MTAPTWFTRPLEEGDSGPDVRHAQVLLHVPPTGVFDNDTATLVRGLQYLLNEPATGVIDVRVATVLGERATQGLVPTWWVRDIDLTTVSDLADAVRRFQSANHLTPTGVIDVETAKLIGEA